jgi:hypothetical protein
MPGSAANAVLSTIATNIDHPTLPATAALALAFCDQQLCPDECVGYCL